MYQTKSQANKERASLEEIKAKYYARYRTQIDWFEKVFFKMPEAERMEAMREWDRYYKACGESPEALLSQEIVRAYKAGDDERFQDLVSQAQEMRKKGIVEIPRPRGFDPMIWNNTDGIAMYRYAKSKLKDSEGENDFDQIKTAEVSTGLAW
jgi:hypothetical protein